MAHPKVTAALEELLRYSADFPSACGSKLVDLAATFVRALAEEATVNDLLNRAKQCEEPTSPLGKVESARNALTECAGESGIWLLDIKDVGELGRLRLQVASNLLPSEDFFHRPDTWRVRKGKTFPIYNGRELHQPKSEPPWKPLYSAMIDDVRSFLASENQDHLWGCFLLAQCRPLVEIGRSAFDRLAKSYSEDCCLKLKAMQDAAFFLVSAKPEVGQQGLLGMSNDARSEQGTIGDHKPPATTGKNTSGKGRMTADEANQTVLELAKKNPNFVHGGVRDWAAAIKKASGKTCSISTVQETALWGQTMKTTGRGRTKGQNPKASPLIPNREEVYGSGEPHEVLNKLVAEEETTIQAIRQSTLAPEEQEAILEKLRLGEMSLATASEVAEMYRKKPNSKPFRRV